MKDIEQRRRMSKEVMHKGNVVLHGSQKQWFICYEAENITIPSYKV